VCRSGETKPWGRAISTSTGGRFTKDSAGKTEAEEIHQNLGEMIKPTDFQKKVLVWGHIYKSVDEVPERVSSPKMKKARDLFRIRVNILMGVMTLGGCIVMIFWGRALRDSGDSLDARGQAQIQEWAKKGAEERAEKKRREDMSK